MIPRLNISFPLKNQWAFCFGQAYSPAKGEYLLNHARSGIVMALRAALPDGGRVGVAAYNCHTVANAVVEAGCTPVFVDVTEELKIDLEHLAKQSVEAMIVTNLFGIHNDIAAMRKVQPNTVLIIDNAHGYGLPAEGDFTVYSINQGKFPALGEGGILVVNDMQYTDAIQQQYDKLSGYSRGKQLKLFLAMLIKAWMHTPWIYGLITKRMKAHRGKVVCREKVIIRRMAKGVSRLYQQALPSIKDKIAMQRNNAQLIADALTSAGLAQRVWYGDNAFMAIARTNDIAALQQYCLSCGVETATHFARAIEWARQLGYTQGTCPMTERLTKEVIMIPTYIL